MKGRGLLWVAALAVSVAGAARAADKLNRHQGAGIVGTITRMSPLEVVIKNADDDTPVPVNEIESIIFEGEPAALRLVRIGVKNGDYDSALELFNKIDATTVARQEVLDDLEFYRALALSRQALGAGSDVREAGRLMKAFVDHHPQSYHLLEANEVLGDLLVAVGAYDQAVACYAQLDRATWPAGKVHSAVAVGRTLVVQKKYPEALAAFEKALAASPGGDKAIEAERQAATLGKAACLAATGKPDDGIRLVQEVIDQADPAAQDLYARAYVTLGNCYRQKPGATKEALLAFLHVDVLYSSQAAAHAEALANLKELWTELGNPARAAQAAQTLQERYKDSPWAKQAPPG